MAGREDVFRKAMSDGHSAAWDQEWEKAAMAYQQALKEMPNHPKALSSLGLAFFQLERYEDSLEAYKQAAHASPEDPIPPEKVALLSERLGDRKQAIQSATQAAELYIKNMEVEKAIENWLRVTQLDPDNIGAHSRLAMVHERLGHTPQAVTEYLAIASLLQRSGHVDKAAEIIGRVLRLKPDSDEARQAQRLLKGGQLLPKPMHPKGGTSQLRMSQAKQEGLSAQDEAGLDPVEAAHKKALARQAEVLFELSDENGDASPVKRGMQAIVRGTGPLSAQKASRAMAVLHLSQAIDAQSNNRQDQAAEELEHVLEAGFKEPAIYFDLGLLRTKGERFESGMRYLQHAVKHNDYALGARLLMAGTLCQLRRLPEAASEYMEALKLADSMVVPPEQADEIRQLYEPLIEAQSRQEDKAILGKLCDNIKDLLLHPDWSARVKQARGQLPAPTNDMPSMPLAEVLTQIRSSQVIEAIGRVHQLARDGRLRSAMDEAFYSIQYAPTYLPLHTLIGDLLIQDGRMQDAIAKYTVVAQSYSVRGEAVQATNLLRRVIQMAPMDFATRIRLIDQLTARGQVDEALGEYLDLADIHYRLAELDMARKTYTAALQQAQHSSKSREWSLKILQRMADIDMQHLDWKQALKIFEQIRSLRPDDMSVRKNLVELNLHLNQPAQASTEVESFIKYLETKGQRSDSIPFLEELVKEHPRQVAIRYFLSEEYRHAGRLTDAVTQLDVLGELLLEAGDRPGAIQAVEAIIAMNPPNVKDYGRLLSTLRSGS